MNKFIIPVLTFTVIFVAFIGFVTDWMNPSDWFVLFYILLELRLLIAAQRIKNV